ncbi:MAG: co-chaperone GroES [Candidatus Cloacimonetes bacterium]|nr:co-chaperone GroES [Candidatus Cloacimonadota bacterium]
MEIRPLDDRVLIQPQDISEKKVGNIIIPDTAKEKPNIGEVIAVGTDEELQKIVKVGDRVLYGKYSGTEIEVEGKKYIICTRTELLAIIL